MQADNLKLFQRGSRQIRFDRIFRRSTGFATLDRLLKRLHANKAELLRVPNMGGVKVGSLFTGRDG